LRPWRLRGLWSRRAALARSAVADGSAEPDGRYAGHVDARGCRVAA